MIYVGIDQSLTGSGIAILDDLDNQYYHLLSTSREKNSKAPSIDYTRRLMKIKKEVKELILQYKPDYIAIEGMAFGAKGRAIFDIGGLSHILREAFIELNIPFIVVPPPVLKKYWTGKGNSSKGDMISEAENRHLTIEDFKKLNGENRMDDNLVDASALAYFIRDIVNNKEDTLKEQVEYSW